MTNKQLTFIIVLLICNVFIYKTLAQINQQNIKLLLLIIIDDDTIAIVSFHK